MTRNISERQKIVKPYYKYKQKAFIDLVKAVEVIAARVWGNGKPLNFSPSDFVFEISYTLGSFKKISIYREGGSLGEIVYENGVFYNYYGRIKDSARGIEKKRVALTLEEFKSLRVPALELGKLTEEEPADFLLHYVIKASENEIARYNPFPGGGGSDSRVYWVKE